MALINGYYDLTQVKTKKTEPIRMIDLDQNFQKKVKKNRDRTF